MTKTPINIYQKSVIKEIIPITIANGINQQPILLASSSAFLLSSSFITYYNLIFFHARHSLRYLCI